MIDNTIKTNSRQLTLPKFYPIAPNAAWVSRLASWGAKLIQLRIKDLPAQKISEEIIKALAECRGSGSTLVVNDYWREAIDCGAPFVHLGQDDLKNADVAALKRGDIHLGISTHSHDELEIALRYDPDYVALGPIYPTTLKVMPWQPQGLVRISEWKALARRPLVAIGGLTVERASDVYKAGADSIAVVSDVINHADPEKRAAQWLSLTS